MSVICRYEKKFILSPKELQDFRCWHKCYFYEFKQSFPPRTVNNIYFDSYDFDNFYENLSGHSKRAKCRLRWYGDNPEVMRFEVKIKKNQLGRKLCKEFDYKEIEPLISNPAQLYNYLKNNIGEELRMYLDKTPVPQIINSYHREYYSTEEDVRLTVDTNLRYSRFKGEITSNSRCWNNDIIVEVKYDMDKADIVLKKLRTFPFRVEKSSKYVNAVNFNCS